MNVTIIWTPPEIPVIAEDHTGFTQWVLSHCYLHRFQVAVKLQEDGKPGKYYLIGSCTASKTISNLGQGRDGITLRILDRGFSQDETAVVTRCIRPSLGLRQTWQARGRHPFAAECSKYQIYLQEGWFRMFRALIWCSVKGLAIRQIP